MTTRDGLDGGISAGRWVTELVLIPRSLAPDDATFDARLAVATMALAILEVIAADPEVAAVVVEAVAAVATTLVWLEVAV